MSLLALEVIFKKANRKSDDSVTLSFETQGEINTEQFSFIDGFRKKTGHLLFSSDAIKATDIPKGNSAAAGGNTPSQELRSSLYAVWKAKTDRKLLNEEWDTYYANAIMGFKRAVDKSHPDREE
jgi:hypothetical protein